MKKILRDRGCSAAAANRGAVILQPGPASYFFTYILDAYRRGDIRLFPIEEKPAAKIAANFYLDERKNRPSGSILAIVFPQCYGRDRARTRRRAAARILKAVRA